VEVERTRGMTGGSRWSVWGRWWLPHKSRRVAWARPGLVARLFFFDAVVGGKAREASAKAGFAL
jgi:hypothetical protein